ncbi:MAG: hypothetical protein H0X03_08040, partial [Nitrosopumilus sp.]|nr:hypothetical protein [Nitrosopumilus sp.]
TNIHAHNFDTDDNSTFLTLVNKILIENRLINNSIAVAGNDSNQSLAPGYIKNIEKIIDDIVISEDSFVVDSDQFYNNTIIAVVVANLADEVLRKYRASFGVPSNVMLSMNFTNIINIENNTNTNNNALNPSNHYNLVNMDVGNNSIDSLNDKSEYYNALEISDRMIEIYNKDLNESLSDSSQKNTSLSNLKDALYELNKDINQLDPPSKIMEIIHGKIHPNLQLAFNLTLKR